MLNKVTLINFGNQRKLEVGFGSGLNAVKGRVEAGKSTLLRAISYALFGAKALPSSLEDTVTFGNLVSTLRVELDFTLGGVKYQMTRSKGGAELRYEGGVVTGQIETAKFISEQLGTDVNLATKLLIAQQGDIRGALTGGSRGATELIERLADFQQLDDLLELVQTNLVTGSPAPLKARLERAEEVLEQTSVPQIDEQEAMQAVDAAQANAANFRTALQAALKNLREIEAERDGALTDAAAEQARATKHEERSKALRVLLGEEPEKAQEPPPLGLLEQQMQACATSLCQALAAQALQGYNETVLDAKYGAVGAADNSRYEGNETSARQELEAVRRSIAHRETGVGKLIADIARTEALILSGECSACGLDLTDVPKVKAKNAELRDEVDVMRAVMASALAEKADEQAYAGALEQALAVQTQVKTKLVDGLIGLDDRSVPGNLKWIGGPTQSVQGAQDRLDTARQALQDARDARARIEQTRRVRADWERRVEAARAAVRAVAPPAAIAAHRPMQELTEAVGKAREQHDRAFRQHEEMAQFAQNLRHETERALSAYRAAKAALQHAECEVAIVKADLKQLEFNNALLKAVREARPTVTNRLWALVLSAVSTYFSDMRGTPSVVTREGGEFMVDGHPVATLSGSTIDALGLAVRVALLRTFLPNLSLLILDEPNAAMDAERTAQVLGFVSAAGFEQTLIVSHDEMTTDVADHIITLE